MNKRQKRGFTLIEFIAAIAIMGIIFLGLAQVVLITIRSFDIALAGSNLIGQSDVGFMRMAREIRQIKNKTSLITATSSDIRFIDINNNDIEYTQSGNSVTRNTKGVMDNVMNLTFEYYDKNGNTIANPIVSPLSTNVRSVRVTLTMNISTQVMTVRSQVRLRNAR